MGDKPGTGVNPPEKSPDRLRGWGESDKDYDARQARKRPNGIGRRRRLLLGGSGGEDFDRRKESIDEP